MSTFDDPTGRLAQDAAALRDLFARKDRDLVAVAQRLGAVREREKWTWRQLIDWCQVESIGPRGGRDRG